MAQPRNVRFAPEPDFRTYEVMSPEPSPSFSTSTLDSDEPSTPPRFAYPLFETHPDSPASFTFIQNENQLPSMYKADERVMLDKALVPPASQNVGVELWMDRHLFERKMESLPGISRYVLEQPATIPPLKEMVITSEYLPQGKQLYITPSSSSPSAYITVRDVFLGVRKELWKRTSNDEYRNLSQYRRDSAKQAYARRYQSVTGGPAVVSQEKNDGIKYVDLLPDSQRFAGLYPGTNSQHWRLVLDISRNQPYPLQ